LLGSGTAPGIVLVPSIVAATVILVSGAFFFRRMEARFADVI
jgi:lipopolysaccharide transport system permease protein